ncbi:DUF1778 domain-containing protein [Comamonas odontotermitis]|uniref:type II toxin -antitoxin system TacA 1-like antitoxin n=1 Tax=Comamonas odontotermitis TaxID=379895 RepID=UPI00367157D2
MAYENRKQVREKKITVRSSEEMLPVIHLAAELSGLQLAQFVYQAAIKRGLEVIREKQAEEGKTSNA